MGETSNYIDFLNTMASCKRLAYKGGRWGQGPHRQLWCPPVGWSVHWHARTCQLLGGWSPPPPPSCRLSLSYFSCLSLLISSHIFNAANPWFSRRRRWIWNSPEVWIAIPSLSGHLMDNLSLCYSITLPSPVCRKPEKEDSRGFVRLSVLYFTPIVGQFSFSLLLSAFGWRSNRSVR